MSELFVFKESASGDRDDDDQDVQIPRALKAPTVVGQGTLWADPVKVGVGIGRWDILLLFHQLEEKIYK